MKKLDTLEVHFRKQEGGYRLWLVTTNPDCIKSHCTEIKTAYRINKTETLRLAYEWADYFRNELGKKAEIKELEGGN